MSDIYQKYDEFKNFEILFKGYDDEIHKVSGKVRAIESSNIIVYASKKKNRFTDIPEGASIKVYVYTENGWEYLLSMAGIGGGGDGNMKDEIYDPDGSVLKAGGIPNYVKENATQVTWSKWTAADFGS